MLVCSCTPKQVMPNKSQIGGWAWGLFSHLDVAWDPPDPGQNLPPRNCPAHKHFLMIGVQPLKDLEFQV